MSSPMATALPYGIRDVKLTPYIDASGTILGAISIDLPNMQTFSFSETEEFTELRGDDKVVTTRGQGSQVEWQLESGGISLRAWAVFSGGSVTESGTTPNRSVTFRKQATQSRPFFRAEGQAISDSGGDLHTFVYRCRCNDSIEGEFADGEFFVTSASGLGLPLLDQEFDLLYDIVQNETAKTINANVPIPNPIGPPTGLNPGAITATTAVINFGTVVGATSYLFQKSSDQGLTWTAATTTPSPATTTPATVSGLSASTTVLIRAAAKNSYWTSDYSSPIAVTTPAS